VAKHAARDVPNHVVVIHDEHDALAFRDVDCGGADTSGLFEHGGEPDVKGGPLAKP
jgi:hypothetical protein